MTLPPDIYSPDQISEMTMELRAYIDALRDASVRSNAGAASGTGMPVMSAPLKSLFESTSAGGWMTPENMLRELEALLKKAPVVHLLLAAAPGKELKKQLTLWFRVEINPNTLLTFTERRDLGGGVMVRVGSHIYDFTFRRKILDNKKRLTELA